MFRRLNRKIVNYVIGGPLFGLKYVGKEEKKSTIYQVGSFFLDGMKEMKKGIGGSQSRYEISKKQTIYHPEENNKL